MDTIQSEICLDCNKKLNDISAKKGVPMCLPCFEIYNKNFPRNLNFE